MRPQSRVSLRTHLRFNSQKQNHGYRVTRGRNVSLLASPRCVSLCLPGTVHFSLLLIRPRPLKLLSILRQKNGLRRAQRLFGKRARLIQLFLHVLHPFHSPITTTNNTHITVSAGPICQGISLSTMMNLLAAVHLSQQPLNQ